VSRGDTTTRRDSAVAIRARYHAEVDYLAAPIRALVAFFDISVMGALGYCGGVIGCVLIPGMFVGLRKLRAPTGVAAPVAVIAGIYGGGIVLALFLDSVGDVGFGGTNFNNIETHSLAVARLNDCRPVTDALGTPIAQTGTGHGTYESKGAFGTSTWQIDVAGPKRNAVVRYAAEKHGDVWGFTAMEIKLDDKVANLASCLRPHTAKSLVHAERKDVIGLWGEQASNKLVLTRIAADGTFVVAAFDGPKLVLRARGTWELSDRGLVWHFDKANSQVPAGYWDAMGEDRIKADTNPILEIGPAKLVYEEMDGRRTEVVAMDPARLEPFVQQLDAR
jgi:hypothetical protein